MRIAARLLVAVALLLAQHAALAHQIWHLGKSDSQPVQSQLCDQHAAFATVAGALDGASFEAPLPAATEVPCALAAAREATAPRVAPSSRSPPRTAPSK